MKIRNMKVNQLQVYLNNPMKICTFRDINRKEKNQKRGYQ